MALKFISKKQKYNFGPSEESISEMYEYKIERLLKEIRIYLDNDKQGLERLRHVNYLKYIL